MSYNKKRMLFHLMAATFLTGKSCSEYLKYLYDEIPLIGQAKVGAKITDLKKNRFLKQQVIETKVKVDKLLSEIHPFIHNQPGNEASTYEHVQRLEDIVSGMLMLSDTAQKRVLGLIEKIKKEPSEIAHMEEFNREQEELENRW